MITEGDLIEDAAGLDALPEGAVVLSARTEGIAGKPRPFEKILDDWNVPGIEEDFASSEIALPARVLYLPED